VRCILPKAGTHAHTGNPRSNERTIAAARVLGAARAFRDLSAFRGVHRRRIAARS
jgi:hypothetical protein